MWEETKPGKGKKFFSLLISIIFERLNYGCFQGVLFSKPFGGKYFKICEGWQKYSVDERSVQHWTTEIVSFLTYFVYSRYILFLSQNLFKLSWLVLKWPWSCRSNIQKCLEHLNLAKIIKWKFKSRTTKRIATDLAFGGFFF